MSANSKIISEYLEFLKNEGPGIKTPKELETEFLAPLQYLLMQEFVVEHSTFLRPISYYTDFLDNTSPTLIDLMVSEREQSVESDKTENTQAIDERKEAMLRKLQVSYLLLLAQIKHERVMNINENQTLYTEYIKKCAALIDKLNPEESRDVPNHMVKYLGLYLGIEVKKEMDDFTDDHKRKEWMDIKTESTIDFMNWINSMRLYWVWGSSLLKTMLTSISQEYFHTARANQLAHVPDPYTGTLSWALYFFRFMVNFSVVIKHTIPGSWMSEDEKKIPAYKRFKTQVYQRKFTLINDFFWGFCNLACARWLIYGAKNIKLGPAGDLFTLILLAMDLALTLLEADEEFTKFTAKMNHYKNEIAEIELMKQRPENAPTLIKEYEHQLHELKMMQLQCQRAWDRKQIAFTYGTYYAIGLLLAFALLALPFLPITGPAFVILSMIGAVCCFAFSVVYNMASGSLEITKTKDKIHDIHESIRDKIQLFKILKRSDNPATESELKFLFLEIKALQADTHIHQQEVVLQTMHLCRSTMLEVLIPAIVFVSIVYLPLGFGLIAIGSVLVIAFSLNKWIDETYKPLDKDAATFNKDEFNEFYNNPGKYEPEHTVATKGLFSRGFSYSKVPNNDPDDDIDPQII